MFYKISTHSIVFNSEEIALGSRFSRPENAAPTGSLVRSSVLHTGRMCEGGHLRTCLFAPTGAQRVPPFVNAPSKFFVFFCIEALLAKSL